MESRRVCVRGIIAKDGKLLAVKHKNDNGEKADYWATPGGGIDPMESLQDALVREMVEETGIVPEIGRLLLIQQFATKNSTNHDEVEQLEFFFEVTNSDDYESINLASTSHGSVEIAEYGFVDPSSENILPKILKTPEFLATLNDKTSQTMLYTDLG